MIFPSVVFLFAFLPAVFFFYFVILKNNPKAKNILLLFASLFFYAWGEGKNVILLILSAVMNYLFGLKALPGKKGKPWMAAAAVFNLSFLFVYKYLDFAISSVNDIFGTGFGTYGIALPIGISFFTFQALSYVADVHMGRVEAQKDPLAVALYISFFPQLVAGPIVRYSDIAKEIRTRKETKEDFVSGTERFIEGMGKKVLLADTFSLFSDRLMAQVGAGELISTAAAWFGVLCFMLRIYYDFSGYSDMAIGLGRMFGFHFNENFDHPYIADSVTDTWRRWHISLGSWFKDYVYIPLGGSKKGKFRTFLNQFVVWTLTGLWHGADVTYIAWGLLNFVFLNIEKYTGLGKRVKLPKILAVIYADLIFAIGLVFFFAPDMITAIDYLGRLIGAGAGMNFAAGAAPAAVLLDLSDNIIFFITGIIFCFPVYKFFERRKTLKRALLTAVFLLCVIYIQKGGYSPFIYFNF